MTNDQYPMTNPKRSARPQRQMSQPRSPELYQVIIHCRDEAQQRELFERLRREGLRCRLTVL
jgi:hypothetical protein